MLCCPISESRQPLLSRHSSYTDSASPAYAPEPVTLDIHATMTRPMDEAITQSPETQTDGCMQRVSQRLTPFYSAVVMGAGAFVTGLGVALARNDFYGSSYTTAEFIAGTSVAGLGTIASTIGTISHTIHPGTSTELPCYAGIPLKSFLYVTGMAMAGFAGYAAAGLGELASGNWK